MNPTHFQERFLSLWNNILGEPTPPEPEETLSRINPHPFQKHPTSKRCQHCLLHYTHPVHALNQTQLI